MLPSRPIVTETSRKGEPEAVGGTVNGRFAEYLVRSGGKWSKVGDAGGLRSPRARRW
jgi:hypothetical protein